MIEIPSYAEVVVKSVRVVIRFVPKPVPYYHVSGRGWADVATTPEGAVEIAALRLGLADDEDLTMRISWEDVPDNFEAPDLLTMTIPTSEPLLN